MTARQGEQSLAAQRITPADLEWWLRTAPTLNWRFATSMPDVPHSYVVRGKQLKDPDFLRAVKVIRTFGQPGKFYSATNIYLTYGNRKWWTMGDTLDGTIIINTATTERTYGRQDAPSTRSGWHTVYDELACDYDARYTHPSDIEENERMHHEVSAHFGAYAPRTLDVGCGTGLLLDLGVTAPGLFTGIDPSQAMLNELIRKHPRVKSIIAARAEDVIDDFTFRAYELVTAWFGVASYLPPEVIKKLPSLSTDLTILMHYRDGYLPDYYGPEATWEGIGYSMAESIEAAYALPDAEHFDLNHFAVTVVRSS